jgi:hypothetical protein
MAIKNQKVAVPNWNDRLKASSSELKSFLQAHPHLTGRIEIILAQATVCLVKAGKTPLVCLEDMYCHIFGDEKSSGCYSCQKNIAGIG